MSSPKKSVFNHFARATSHATGRPAAFVIATLTIVIWAATGPLFHFSDTWQLVINTSTTVVTFLMVFLIQNTQNRDSEAMHLKLDELIRASDAQNEMCDLDELDDDALKSLHDRYVKLASDANEKLSTRAPSAP